MANQVKRSKIANCLNYGGYAGRLRRLCEEKEKARDRFQHFNIFLHWMTMAADNDGAVVVTGACLPISRRSDRAGQSIYSVGFCRLPG